MENKVLTINSLYERLSALERHFRGFNLRFYKIPEHTDEDCIDILEKLSRFKPETSHRERSPYWLV